MNNIRLIFLLNILLLTFIISVRGEVKSAVSIVVPGNGTSMEKLAAREVRKYIYQRTNLLLPVISLKKGEAITGDVILVASSGDPVLKAIGIQLPDLENDAFLLKTYHRKQGKLLLICGGSPVGNMYAAYHLAEQLGIGFFLDGDVIPDQQVPFVFPELDIVQKPLFERRGIQPFHDFPEGPDWWNLSDYKAIFAQLPKLKMNFFGLHTYPEGSAGPEPLTWIGLSGDVSADGNVKSAYHARHFTIQNTTSFGFQGMNRSQYSFGTGQLFDRDDFGAEYMRNRTPWPKPEDEIALFNDMGKFLADALTFAGTLGIKTCLGTEIPLVLPDQFKELLKKRGLDPESADVRQHIYEGIFTRIKNTHPLDFYWFWTNGTGPGKVNQKRIWQIRFVILMQLSGHWKW
jgi:hypothetical protein